MNGGNKNVGGIDATNNDRIEGYCICPEKNTETVAFSKEELVYIVAHSPIRLVSAYATNKFAVDARVDMIVK
jgi:hypothetical protein